MSTVGILNLPEREKMLPMSVSESIGETVGETPPSLSDSARFMQIRNSYSVSPPKADARNTPSGIKDSLYAESEPSRSLTQCKEELLTIRSREESWNLSFHLAGSPSSPANTTGMISSGIFTPFFS